MKLSKPNLLSAVNSQISTPRLTPLRMIERNRATDKTDIDRLEFKIQELEKQIFVAKEVGEKKKLDKLEQSILISAERSEVDFNLLDAKKPLDENELELLQDCMFEYGDEEASQPVEKKEETLFEAFTNLQEFVTSQVTLPEEKQQSLSELLMRVGEHIYTEKLHVATQCQLQGYFSYSDESDSDS